MSHNPSNHTRTEMNQETNLPTSSLTSLPRTQQQDIEARFSTARRNAATGMSSFFSHLIMLFLPIFAHQRNCLATITKGTFCGLQFSLQNYCFVCLTIISKIQPWTLHYLHDIKTWKLQLEKIFQGWRIYFFSIYFVFNLFLVIFATIFLIVRFDF